MIIGERNTCWQTVGRYDDGPMQEDQWFSLFCAPFTLWIVQHDVDPQFFFMGRAVRVCAVCLPALGAGWPCLLARLPSDVYTSLGTMVTV